MSAPIFSFAVLADIQYADKVDGHFEGRTQRFREVPSKLAAAVDDLVAHHKAGGGLTAAVHLGDIVDGYPGAADEAARAARDLKTVTAQLARLPAVGVPVRHVFGNHCFAVPRGALLAGLGFPGGSSGYYAAPLGPGWRLMVLDTTDVSLFGHDKDAPEAKQAAAWLAAHPVAAHPNAQPWNGGLGAAQLAWLRARLSEAAAAGERVIVACHHPLAPGSAPDHYLAWGHEDLRAALEERPGVVALAMAGHYHPGGAASFNGVHYVTLEGLLEAPPGSNAYAVVEVHRDRLAIRGVGAATSRELPLAPLPA